MTRILVNFRKTDEALYEHVMAQEDKTKYIRRLIREDMARMEGTYKPESHKVKEPAEDKQEKYLIDAGVLNSYL